MQVWNRNGYQLEEKLTAAVITQYIEGAQEIDV
jgi:hypothetical protein